MERSAPKWEEIDALLDRVLDLPADERSEFLDALTPEETDPRVVSRVRAMLPNLDSPTDILDRPVGELLGDDFLATPAPDESFATGRRVGNYRIDGELGRGGMGRVFAASRDDGEFKQDVALKVLRWEFADARSVERFKTERQLLASLDHPGIARLIDGGVTDSGLPYLVMERVTGQTIDAFCAERALRVADRVELIREVCHVVEHAHRHLVVHRDLKPSNIMVSESGDVKLLDFGVAKMLEGESQLTQEGHVPLTPNYGAPEQISGNPITPATDVYALGVVLHELLTGARPHEADAPTRPERARRVVSDAPPLPSTVAGEGGAQNASRLLRGDLDSILLKALAIDPRDRYPSAERLADDLGRHLRREPVLAVSAGRMYRLDRFIRRNRAGVAAGGLLVASVAFGFAGTLAEADRARRESERARMEARRAGTVAAMMGDLFGLADPFVTGGSISPKDLLSRGVMEARERLADDPPTMAALFTTLGNGFVGLGEYSEAYPVLADAVALARATGDPDLLAGALAALGGLELQRLSYDSAGELFEEALAVQEANGPGELRGVLLGALARQRLGVGDAESALAFNDSALAVFAIAEPRDRRTRLRVAHFRGPILRALGDAEGAAAVYSEVLDDAKATLPATDQLITATLNNLAFLRKEMGNLEGAEAAYRESLALLEEQVGPAHPDAIRVRTNLTAVIAGDPERLPEAEALMARNASVLRELGPPGVIRLERALTGLMGAYLTWGMPEKAEATAREAIALTAELPDGAPTIRRLHEFRLALALLMQGRDTEAGRLQRAAIAAIREGGALNSSGRGTLRWLAGQYDAAGFPEAAADLRSLGEELTPAGS